MRGVAGPEGASSVWAVGALWVGRWRAVRRAADRSGRDGGGSEELTPEAREAVTPQRSGLFGPLQLDSSRDRALTEGFGVCNCSGE